MFEVGRNLVGAMQVLQAPMQALRRVLSLLSPDREPDDDAEGATSLSRREMARRRRRDYERARRDRGSPNFGFVTAALASRRAMALVAGAVLLVVAVSVMRPAGHVRKWAASQLPSAELAAAALGLGIDQISLEGHEFTYDGDVFDALDLGNAKTFAAFDAKAAKERIERLPWVATAELTRVYPNRLDIRVTERKPYAVWTRGDKTFLVDVTGRVLAPVLAGSTPELPRIKGEGAPEAAKAFLDLIDRFPALRARFAEAERFGERRWTLRLKGKVEILLPAQAEERALSEIMSDRELASLAGGESVTIDYRVKGRVAINRMKDIGAAAPGT